MPRAKDRLINSALIPPSAPPARGSPPPPFQGAFVCSCVLLSVWGLVGGVERGNFLPRMASPRPMSPRHRRGRWQSWFVGRWLPSPTPCFVGYRFVKTPHCGLFTCSPPAPSQEILKRGFGHSREVGFSCSAHFRDRPPCGRSLPRAAKRESSCTAGNAKYPGYWDAPNIPLRRQVGMKNC